MCKYVWIKKESTEIYILSLPFILPFLMRNLVAFKECPIPYQCPLCPPYSILLPVLGKFSAGLTLILSGELLPKECGFNPQYSQKLKVVSLWDYRDAQQLRALGSGPSISHSSQETRLLCRHLH